MDKHGLSIVNIYFITLFFVVLGSIINSFDVINGIYLVVILCSLLKYNFIVSDNKK